VSERVGVETVVVGQGGGRELNADLYRAPSPNGVGILLIHGGSFIQGDRSQLHGYGIALARIGYTCLACEYRLAREDKWPAQIDDVHTALAIAGTVVGIELFVIAWVRYRFLHVSLRNSLLMVTCGGAIVVAIGVLIGSS